MKKTRFAITLLLSCIMLVLNVSGVDSETRVIDYANDDITVTFEDAVYVNEERYAQIADRLVYGNEYSTDGLSWCWLVGHDIKSNTVNVITHNARSVSPRCLSKAYYVETCSKCDYYTEELISSVYIVCH